ncbi:MAG: hypothetical protein JST85_23105 [Acidobacteria bacterium]|nr:hypothetical protein [Acidobacteriota bacterium]
MRKVIAVISLAVLLATTALADTLYLKNGSVLKGTFIGYENGQFIFELPNGNRPRFRPAEVDRLVIDRDTVGNNRPDPERPVPPARDPQPGGGNASWDSFPAFNVQLEEKWIRSSVQVTRGQRIRVDATGTVTLEGRTQTGPDGLNNRRDPDAPMPDANDGALIAAIGQDPNSLPIFIGRGVEFIAEHDGPLYFTVNHWETANARGAFRVTVAIDRNYRDDTVGGNTGGGRPTQGQEKTVLVYANQQWTDTGIDVEPNMTFQISAEGEIEIGNRNYARPEGNQNAKVSGSVYPMPEAGVGALIGKIRYRDGRDSNLVLVGTQGTPSTEAGEYGRLFLGINDDYLRDNKGSYKVTIRW